MYDEKAKSIFKVMIERGLIPSEGQFEITDLILEYSYEIGREIHSSSKKKRSPSDKRFHKKIAGLNLLHLNNERSEQRLKRVIHNEVKQHSGILYIISNPSFPDYVKIGITKDLKKRLATYQTYHPKRNFKVEKYVFIQDVRSVEKSLLEKYKIKDLYTGEWLDTKHKKELFSFMNRL